MEHRKRPLVQQELTDASELLLDAMEAERRMTELSPAASLNEAKAVLEDATIKREQALDRFGTMCARLACGVKD